MSIFGVIFIVFLVLKLAEIGVVATWSWYWVTSPLWIPFAVIFLYVAIRFAAAFMVRLVVRIYAKFFGKEETEEQREVRLEEERKAKSQERLARMLKQWLR
jgi:hypothetical protein